MNERTETPVAADARATSRPASAADRRDALQALLTLLPAAALAWPGPGSFLADDLAPQYTGAGIVALASVPAALSLALRPMQSGVRGLALFLLPLLSAATWIASDRSLDRFDAGRALALWCSGLVLLLSGASLSPRGRSVLAHGVVVIGLVFLAGAAFDGAHDHAGVLGNTGSLSEAALPGALIGVGLLLGARTLWRFVGSIALAGLFLYAALTPVLAGLVSLAIAFAIGAALHKGLRVRARIGLAFLSLIAMATALVPIAREEQSARAGESIAIPNEAASIRSDTGGIEVRSRVAQSSLRLLADHAWVGVGPGQFAATFPPYRDPVEIELSTLGRVLPGETEVEHAHNDWIAPAIDAGAPIGIAWIAFLAVVAVASLAALRRGERIDAALALAAIGLLVNALVDTVFTFNAASSSFACAVFGCVLARTSPARTVFTRRWVAVIAAVLLAASAPHAIAMVKHGRALASLAQLDDPKSPRSAELIQEALDAAPDSVLAATLAARTAELHSRGALEVRPRWLAVLSLRPQRVEPLIKLGYLAAIADRRAEARPYFERALALDPHHPGALQNLMSLELEDGNIERAMAALDRRQATHPISNDWLAEYAARLYLRGLERQSDALLARVQPEFAGLNAEGAYGAAHEFRAKKLEVLGDAFESRARRSWAREHAANAKWQLAAASYRQDLRITRDYVDGGAPEVRLELAAALCLAGKEDEARDVMAEFVPSETQLKSLPHWASDALRDKDWLGR
jgi:tetratricopeptide (TPR) repeat protein